MSADAPKQPSAGQPDPPEGLAALRQYQYVPGGTSVGASAVPAGTAGHLSVRPARVQRKTPGVIRRCLPYVAAITVLAVMVYGAISALPSLGGGHPALSADAQVLADAVQTARAASSFHISGTTTTDGLTLILDMRILEGKGLVGSVTIDGERFDVVVIGTDVYAKAGSAYWMKFGGADDRQAQLLAGKWVKVPGNGELRQAMADFVNPSGLFDRLMILTHDTLTNEGATTYDGQRAVAILDRSPDEGTLYVSATQPAYLIAFVASDRTLSVSFDNWDQPVTLNAPSGAIDPSTLSG